MNILKKKSLGFRVNSVGYYEFTRSENKGVMIHTMIAENMKGRKLRKNEVVHHKDENKLNNDPKNIIVMLRSEHSRIHAKQNLHKLKRNNNGTFKEK